MNRADVFTFFDSLPCIILRKNAREPLTGPIEKKIALQNQKYSGSIDALKSKKIRFPRVTPTIVFNPGNIIM